MWASASGPYGGHLALSEHVAKLCRHDYHCLPLLCTCHTGNGEFCHGQLINDFRLATRDGGGWRRMKLFGNLPLFGSFFLRLTNWNSVTHAHTCKNTSVTYSSLWNAFEKEIHNVITVEFHIYNVINAKMLLYIFVNIGIYSWLTVSVHLCGTAGCSKWLC